MLGVLGLLGEGRRGLSTVRFVASCIEGLVTRLVRGVVEGLFDAGQSTEGGGGRSEGELTEDYISGRRKRCW